MCKALLIITSVVIAMSPVASAAEHWIRLTTPHFEMYTTNSAKQGTAALNVFEQVRYFFLQNNHSKTAPAATVRIIAFRSEKEYKAYRLNEGAFAYYLRSHKVDYIVMQDLAADHYQAAVHEYTHLVVEHLGLKLPTWLNEGLADLYSSLEPKGDQTLIGRPLMGRASVLMNQRWMDWNTLFAVGADSPYYNQADKMSIFYAQSWALTHMLVLGPSYKPAFSKFLGEIVQGHPAADCLQSVYGKSVAQVNQDLHAYLGRPSIQGGLFNVKLSKSDLEPNISELSDFDVDLALDDLLASQQKTMAEAAARLSQLAQQRPESADVEESLGYLEWQQGDTAKAQDSFRLAFDKGCKDPEMLYQYAQLLHQSGASANQVIPVLQRAVALKPDYQDAWFTLGLIALNAERAGEALTAFSHVTKVDEERAFALFSAQAYCYLQLKGTEQARMLAEKAKPYAKTPQQEMQISTLLLHLDALTRKADPNPTAAVNSSVRAATTEPAERPSLMTNDRPELPRDVPSIRWPGGLQHVEGVAKSFDCGKRPRLHVLVNGEEKVFVLENPEWIRVRHGKDGTFDMQCGAQKPFEVDVFYTPAAERAGGDGVVRELVF